jgi:uncharacterized membrane protein YheB (UPF0754 family)
MKNTLNYSPPKTFIFSKKTRKPLWFKNEDLKTHVLILGSTGSGMSRIDSDDIFSSFLDLSDEYLNYFKTFLNILYQAKNEFIKNDTLQVIRFYLDKNKYDFIAENVIDFYYEKSNFYNFINRIFTTLSFIKVLESPQLDISENVIYLNEQLVNNNLNYIVQYFSKKVEDYPNRLQCQQYVNFKIREEEKKYLENIVIENEELKSIKKIKL